MKDVKRVMKVMQQEGHPMIVDQLVFQTPELVHSNVTITQIIVKLVDLVE